MVEPIFYVTPGFGELQRQRHNYSQAVRIGNRVEISGQGGWNDAMEFPESVTDQIQLAFANVARTLETAGANWDHVIEVFSYHVGLSGHQDEVNAAMTAMFRQRMPDHAPIWTLLGVEALGEPNMKVEVRVTAIVPD